jgi:DNA-binding ferritin-like protein
MDQIFDMPNIQIGNNANPMMSNMCDYVGKLEGIRFKLKILHWGVVNLPYSGKKGLHEYLDEFVDMIGDYYDSIVEGISGLNNTNINLSDINISQCDLNTLPEIMQYLENITINYYDGLPDLTKYKGITSKIETFIESIDDYKYKFNITK